MAAVVIIGFLWAILGILLRIDSFAGLEHLRWDGYVERDGRAWTELADQLKETYQVLAVISSKVSDVETAIERLR